MVSAQSWHTDSDGILCSGNDAVTSLWVVLEAEDKLCQHLSIHVGQFYRPNPLYLFASGGGEAASFSYFEVRHKRDGKGPAWCEATDIRLVNPSSCQVESGWNLANLTLKACTRTRIKPVCRCPLKHDILYSALFAEPTLLVACSINIHHKAIRLEFLDRRHKVHHATTFVDESFFDVPNALYHEEAFLLGIERLVVLILQYSRIRPDADVEIAILSGLPEELNVPAMQQIIASANKDFFHFLMI